MKVEAYTFYVILLVLCIMGALLIKNYVQSQQIIKLQEQVEFYKKKLGVE